MIFLPGIFMENQGVPCQGFLVQGEQLVQVRVYGKKISDTAEDMIGYMLFYGQDIGQNGPLKCKIGRASCRERV